VQPQLLLSFRSANFLYILGIPYGMVSSLILQEFTVRIARPHPRIATSPHVHFGEENLLQILSSVLSDRIQAGT
jgi:hypothetical protein